MTTIIAAIIMVIDHVGCLLFPDVLWLRMIGRLSFPLFAYGIARGVAHTSNFGKYFLRILIAAVISQPIYSMVFGAGYGGNPLFTLAWGALVLFLWQKEHTATKLLALALMCVSVWVNISYGWYGVCTIFVFGIYKMRKDICFIGQALLQVLYIWQVGAMIQVLSLLAFPLAVIEKRILFPKYFFYVFYPVHLLAIWAIGQSML